MGTLPISSSNKVRRVGTLPISSSNKVCRVGTLLLFCFKYRVGRLPFFQLEKNITLTTYLHMTRTFLFLNLHYSVEWEHFLSHRTIKSAELEGFLFFQLDKSKTLSKRKWLNTKFCLTTSKCKNATRIRARL